MHRSSLEVRLWRRRYGRCSWLLSRVPTPAQSASRPSIVEYDVSVFVDFQDCLELAVRNNIHRPRECGGEVNFDAQVAPLHEVETRPVTGVRCQIKPEEGVSIAEIRACQIVSLVLRHFVSGAEQVHVTPDVTTLGKVWLEGFTWNLSTIHVDC